MRLVVYCIERLGWELRTQDQGIWRFIVIPRLRNLYQQGGRVDPSKLRVFDKSISICIRRTKLKHQAHHVMGSAFQLNQLKMCSTVLIPDSGSEYGVFYRNDIILLDFLHFFLPPMIQCHYHEVRWPHRLSRFNGALTGCIAASACFELKA